MNLGDILTTRQIVPELKATNRWEAIDELIGALVAAGKITPADREAVTAVVKKREQSMSRPMADFVALDWLPDALRKVGRVKLKQPKPGTQVWPSGVPLPVELVCWFEGLKPTVPNPKPSE